MLTEEQGNTLVDGFTVYDTVLMMHMIEKLLRGGVITGKELSFVAALRHKAVLASRAAVNFDIEQLNNPVKTATTTQGG